MNKEPSLDSLANIAEFIQRYHGDRIEELQAGAYEEPVLPVSLADLATALPDLFDDLVAYPDVIIPWFEEVAQNYEEVVETAFYDDSITCNVSLVNHAVPAEDDDVVSLAFTDPPGFLKKDIGEPRGDFFGEIVAFEGICQQTSDPKPRILETVFFCKRCGEEREVDCSDTFDLTNVYPNQCAGCERQGPFERNTDRETRREYQQVRVQESPEEARNSSNPREVVCDALGRHLVDVAEPGDRVTVVGIIREDGDSESTLQDNRLEVLSIIPEETQFEEVEISEKDVEHIESIAERNDLYDTLSASIAPGIYGYEDVKLGIAMQLFGGVTKQHYGNRRRGQIHLMCIGDPGTGKSNLLEYARSIAPRAVTSSGTAATAVGLTATAVKEKIGNEEQWTLQAGSLVLADQSLITIDELDKFREDEQRSLNEALAHGEINVDKANVHATLKARCSALMAANPKEGRFDPRDSYHSQFDMPEDLLSRCDLIFTFLDEPDSDVDAEVATAVLNPHTVGEDATADGGEPVPLDENGVIAPDLFRKYVAYARREYNPSLTEDAMGRLHDFYTTVREALSNDSVGLNGRQLGGLRRLTQAFARASLTNTATEEHAEQAIDLLMESLNQTVRDPDGGGFDIDRIESGNGAKSQETRIEAAKEIIRDLADRDSGAPAGKILGKLEGDYGINQDLGEDTLEKLSREGEVYQPEDGKYRVSTD